MAESCTGCAERDLVIANRDRNLRWCFRELRGYRESWYGRLNLRVLPPAFRRPKEDACG